MLVQHRQSTSRFCTGEWGQNHGRRYFTTGIIASPPSGALPEGLSSDNMDLRCFFGDFRWLVAVVKNSQQDEKSRSQIKREFRELKELGKQLAGLSKGQLRALPLFEATRDALLATKGMTRSALQRQYRHLSSLLAREDVAALRRGLTGELQPHAEEVAALHEVEYWRDRLLSADERQLAAFVERYPECDRTRLRQLVRNAKKERDLDKPPRSARVLFRYLLSLADLSPSQVKHEKLRT